MKSSNRSYDKTMALRGLAILMIVVYHVSNPKVLTSDLLSLFLSSNGDIGVWLFIFLSGFSLGSGYLSGKYKITLIGISGFYLRRAHRILPLYYLTGIILFLIGGISQYPDNFKRFLTLDTTITDLPYTIRHFWYIALQARLYLVAPFIFLLLALISKVPRKIRILGYFLPLVTGLLLRNLTSSKTVGYLFSWLNIDLFIFGMTMAALSKDDMMKKLNIQISRKFTYPLSILSIFVLYISGSFLMYNFYINGVLPSKYGSLMPIISALLILPFIFTGTFEAKGLSHIFGKIFGFFGRFSYEIYLFHYPIFTIFSLHCLSSCQPITFIYFLGTTLFLSTGLAVLINFLKKKFIGNIPLKENLNNFSS